MFLLLHQLVTKNQIHTKFFVAIEPQKKRVSRTKGLSGYIFGYTHNIIDGPHCFIREVTLYSIKQKKVRLQRLYKVTALQGIGFSLLC